jgi:hypothetical protein
MVQSRMGNVPKGSLFAFLQSNGARRFAGLALRSGGGWLLVATLLADVGAVLLEKGAENVTVSALLESVWTDQTSNTTANAATGGAVGGFVGMGWQWWGWWGLLMAAWAWLLTRV